VFLLADENTLGPYRQCSDGTDPEWAKRLTHSKSSYRAIIFISFGCASC